MIRASGVLRISEMKRYELQTTESMDMMNAKTAMPAKQNRRRMVSTATTQVWVSALVHVGCSAAHRPRHPC